ncbi:MAG: peptide-methionine (S)-S-oxide reductase MsrA [Candidatus Lernaella stagnicola]|nr:peptide-methionine (S)-S-oxide reductase MsrA [Candidatus Lernaella stagnicola]
MPRAYQAVVVITIALAVFVAVTTLSAADPWTGTITGAHPVQNAMSNFTGNDTSAPLIDKKSPGRIETATFGLGCFWCPDGVFGTLPGVIRTRVGYAGGTKANPTYHSLGNHTETIQVDFDPRRITYAELLDVFWRNHSPTQRPWSRQYRSIVLYENDAQKQATLESRERWQSKSGKKLYTVIEPLDRFYRAEDYHQKYNLQKDAALMAELRAMFPNFGAFVDSTAVARLNGYVSGDGKREVLLREINDYGLSVGARQRLRAAVKR